MQNQTNTTGKISCFEKLKTYKYQINGERKELINMIDILHLFPSFEKAIEASRKIAYVTVLQRIKWSVLHYFAPICVFKTTTT